MNQTLYVMIFLALSVIVILFQFGLALGMPWGSASMGGKFPGKYPPKMRIVALINIFVLLILIIIVFTKAGLIFPQLYSISRYIIWLIVVFFGLGTIMNSITPSRIERVWAPIAGIQLLTTFLIALS